MTIYFVSGIDTDAGKTVATGFMARNLLQAGQRVITMKPVQTGETQFSSDLACHRQMMATGLLPEDYDGLTNPQRFALPASPALAAEHEGKKVDLQCIEHALKELAERFDDVLVEGAGGLMVPLTNDLLTIDWVADHGWPVMFVTSAKLGSVNHTLLAFEAMKHRDMTISHLIFNGIADQDNEVIATDTRNVIKCALARDFPQALWIELPNLKSNESTIK